MRAIPPLVVLVLAGSLLAGPSRAEPVVANRIVAVVGGDPITLTALRKRARISMVAVERSKSPAWQKAKDIRKTLRSTLDELIEETLVARAAEGAHLKVEDAEVERAIQLIAREQHLTRTELIASWITHGYSEKELAEAYRRQILERRVLDHAYAETHADKLAWTGSEANERRAQAFRTSWYATMREAVGVEIRFTQVDPS